MSEWQTKELAETFLRDVRGAIPGAELQLAVLGHIARLWTGTAQRILDLGCGDGILGRFLSELFPSAHVVFGDFSEPMLEAARAKVGDRKSVSVVRADFSTPAWLEAVEEWTPFDLVVSGFAIHHQPDARKRELYGEIYERLSPSGVFLNLEHVASSSGSVEKLFDEFFIEHLFRFQSSGSPGKSRESVASKYYERPDKKENILAPWEAQAGWLREIGFRDVDCFLKVFELALFGGRKPAAGTLR